MNCRHLEIVNGNSKRGWSLDSHVQRRAFNGSPSCLRSTDVLFDRRLRSEVNPALARFAADLSWLKSQGVQSNGSTLPRARRICEESGRRADSREGRDRCLPLILVDGRVVSRGVYPSREELAAFTGIAARESAGGAEHRFPTSDSPAEPGRRCCGGSGCCG